MKEQLKDALASIASGDVQAIAEIAEQIKALPRTAAGLFDMRIVDVRLFRAAMLVYPVYAAYETECNKKEGYPDLIVQMRKLDEIFGGKDCFFATACYLNTLIHTIENVSPQLYEYYSELVDMFKVRVNEAIGKYYQDGKFAGVSCHVVNAQDCAEADRMIRDAIRLAGSMYCWQRNMRSMCRRLP